MRSEVPRTGTWASLPGLVRPACGLAAVSGFRWADTSVGLGRWTHGVGLERVHGTAGFILAFLDTELGLLRVGFCFPSRLKNLSPTLVLRDWVSRGRGAYAWVCEACETRSGERGGKIPTDGDGAAVVGIFWDSPRNPALSPHLSSAMQGGILRKTSKLGGLRPAHTLCSRAEQLRRSGHPPAAAATLCGDLPSLCAYPGKRSGPSHLSPGRSDGDSPVSECQSSYRLCS